MIDMTGVESGDIAVYDTQTTRAQNLLQVQLGHLEYAPEIGIDLDYFLTENINFQTESFIAYVTENLASHGISVSLIQKTIGNLSTFLGINLSPAETSTGFVAE